MLHSDGAAGRCLARGVRGAGRSGRQRKADCDAAHAEFVRLLGRVWVYIGKTQAAGATVCSMDGRLAAGHVRLEEPGRHHSPQHKAKAAKRKKVHRKAVRAAQGASDAVTIAEAENARAKRTAPAPVPVQPALEHDPVELAEFRRRAAENARERLRARGR